MALTKAHNRMIEGSVINVADFGAVGDGVTDDLAAFDAAVNAASSDANAGDTIFIPSGTYYLSGLWHVNKPVHIDGNGAYLQGGDSTGVVWYGYRTGANQNTYYAYKYVKNLIVTSTVAGGDGFNSSKSISCNFENLKAAACTGRGLVFGASVTCTFNKIAADAGNSSGIVFTSFTNADGVTHVPCTANTILNIRAYGNGSVVTDYGVLFGLNPSGGAAAYGNNVLGGDVEANEFTGMRVYGGYNQIRGVWFEHNGIDSGSADQYNLWISGANCLVDGGTNTGAGVKRKIYVDDNLDSIKIENVYFAGTLQTDIEYGGTGVTNHQLENNRLSGSSPSITPSSYNITNQVIGTSRKNEATDSFYWVTKTLDIPANTSGTYQTFNLFGLGASGFGRISADVFDPGSPPTVGPQLVNVPLVTPASNYYFKFLSVDGTSNELESCYRVGGNSNTANIPILQLQSNGNINYKHNNGSSAKTLQYSYCVQP